MSMPMYENNLSLYNPNLSSMVLCLTIVFLGASPKLITLVVEGMPHPATVSEKNSSKSKM
jgi:hypothetical protein